MSSKYKGFYALADGENPNNLGQYYKRSDGATVVPVADAIDPSGMGVAVENTNYETLQKSPDYSKLVDVIGTKGSMSDLMEKAQELQKEATKETPKENPTQSTVSKQDTVQKQPEPSQSLKCPPTLAERTHEVTWDTPMGQFSVLYRHVLISKDCIILVNAPGDKPKFSPVKSSKNNPITYQLTYKGVDYTGVFLGVSANDALMDIIALYITGTQSVR